MNRNEILISTFGEMMDLVNCYNIEMGRAELQSCFSYDDVASALLLE